MAAQIITTKFSSKIAGYAIAAIFFLVPPASSADDASALMSEEMIFGDVPIISSATRLPQPITDSPVAVTVIDRDMIEASGAREIPELFRLVPGFIVGYNDGHTPSVSYHMSIDRYARRMQVLIDGRSVYVMANGGVPWSSLPITLDDIERIEVVRGPNSASYGANSFLGVISITTRHALLDQGASVKVNIGDEGVREGFLRHGGTSGDLDYRVTAGYVTDDGLPVRFDGKQIRMFSARGDYSLSTRDVMSFQAGIAKGPLAVENPWGGTLNLPRYKEELHHYEQVRWERSLGVDESISVQLYHILQRNFEEYAVDPAPLDPVYVDFSRSTQRYDLEMQHNISLGSSYRVAWGLGAREDSYWGASALLGGRTIDNHLKRGFINTEWNPEGPWLMNFGLMVEDYNITGTDASPRLGVNYKFSPAHGVRLTASKAIRTPSNYEYAVDYSLTGYMGGAPVIFYQFELGTEQTTPETIRSYELGYYGALTKASINYDIKIFRDEIRHLITPVKYTGYSSNPGDKTEIYENRDAITIDGLELDLSARLPNEFQLWFTYAFSEIDDDSNNPRIQYDAGVAPKHSVSLLLLKKFAHGYRASAGWYFTDKVQGWNSHDLRTPVRRLDLKLSKSGRYFGKNTEISLALRNVLGKYEEMRVLRSDWKVFDYLNMVDPSAYVSIKVELN